MGTENTEQNKKVHIELLRIMAIFLVLYCHTGMDAVLRLMGAGSAGSFVIGVVMRVLSFTCNILFFMITGALLLKKEEPIRRVLTGRVLKFTAVILIFSFLQMLWSCFYLQEETFRPTEFLRDIYAGPYITQYWYLYQYLGLLLALPLLRILTKHMEPRHYLWLFGLYLLWEGVLPLAEDRLELESFGVEIPFFAVAWVFAMLGHFVENVCWSKLYDKKMLAVINGVGAAAFLVHSLITADTYSRYIITVQNMGLLGIIGAVIYIDVKAMCEKITLPAWLRSVILFVGSGVFGVYLLEPQVRGMYHFIYEALEPRITWFAATVIWLSAALVTGSLIMNVLKRIPGVRRLF